MENQVKKRNVFKALKGLSKKMKVIIGIAIIVVICLFIVLGVNRKSDVDTTFLTQILTKSSELTTAKLKITGLSEYHDEGIYIRLRRKNRPRGPAGRAGAGGADREIRPPAPRYRESAL